MENEILNTRIGGLGSSDADMVKSVGKNGRLNKTAIKRIAVLLDKKDVSVFSTKATTYGKYIEDQIFEFIKNKFSGYGFRSNPYHEIPNLKYKFKCFNHIDIEALKEDKVLWFEIKAVNGSLDLTVKKYYAQLCWHYWVLRSVYKDKNIKLYLLHYHTKDKSSDFNPVNLTLHQFNMSDTYFSWFLSGLEIINNSLDDFQYEEEKELTITQLPEQLQTSLNEITSYMAYEKSIKPKIEQFRQNMCGVMKDKGIKKISCQDIIITYLSESETMEFDKTSFQNEHPRLYKKYCKTKNRKATVQLKIK